MDGASNTLRVEQASSEVRLTGEIGAIRAIFDSAYYLRTYPDIAAAGVDPLSHFLSFGGAEGRNPCALFDTTYYRSHSPDIAASGLNPLVHYVCIGARKGFAPSPLFDPEWYLSQAPNTGDAARANPLAHYLHSGWREGRAAHPLFDQAWYLERCPEARADATCPLAHYAEHGARTRHSPHPLFDASFYLERYPDVAAAGVNPLADYLRRGHLEPLQPHPLFDAAWYLGEYADVAAAKANPLLNYVVRGARRSPNRDFDAAWYLRTSTSSMKEGFSPLVHYVRHGRWTLDDTTTGFVDPTAGKSPHQVADLIKASARAPSSPPLVTVVIPVYQQLPYTLRCLLSVLESKDRTPFQVLIVDDQSPDQSGAFLSAALEGLPGIRVALNTRNLGFLRSCNAATASITTDYIFFLNNDTIVIDGWLDELVDTFRHHPDAGLVGSKLVYPNGTLQEAGGIIWDDASGANFGRGNDPQKPEYNYLRDADYISGAAILVERSVWEQVGGFSDEFAPAYYEDTDLAMKIRALGRRVLYQPLSTVVHFEGTTSGTDINQGVKRHQEINRITFLNKWRSTLATHGKNADFDKNIVDRRPKGRILIFDAEVPTPDKDSGSVTAFNYARILTEFGYRVTFVPENLAWCGRYSRALQRLGVEVIYGPHHPRSDDYVLQHASLHDLVILSRAPNGGKLINKLRDAFPNKPIVFDTVDLHHLRLQRQYELERRPELLQQARELEWLELNAIRKADLTILVSDAEVAYLEDKIGSFPHMIIPLIYEPVECAAAFDKRRDFAFVGGFRHLPNVDAVNFLVQAIWPRFRRYNTGAQLHIVGSHMPPEFGALACSDINIVGFVPDLEHFMAKIRVSLAPLRYGAGVKGKVGNSLRMGVPVIGTPIAFEGMGLSEGMHALVGHHADEFTQAMHQLYTNHDLWQSMSRHGREYVLKSFGLDAARTKLKQMLQTIIIPDRRN